MLNVAFDAIFTKNLPPVLSETKYVSKTKVLFFEQGNRIKPCPSREKINRRATELYCKDVEAPYPSDHFPIKWSGRI